MSKQIDPYKDRRCVLVVCQELCKLAVLARHASPLQKLHNIRYTALPSLFVRQPLALQATQVRVQRAPVPTQFVGDLRLADAQRVLVQDPLNPPRPDLSLPTS